MNKIVIQKNMANTGSIEDENKTGAKGRLMIQVYKKCKVCNGRKKEEDMDCFNVCSDCLNKADSYLRRVGQQSTNEIAEIHKIVRK